VGKMFRPTDWKRRDGDNIKADLRNIKEEFPSVYKNIAWNNLWTHDKLSGYWVHINVNKGINVIYTGQVDLSH
jgi:hypothetical protein